MNGKKAQNKKRKTRKAKRRRRSKNEEGNSSVGPVNAFASAFGSYVDVK